MSVLYKALQKAAKENEQQASDQTAPSAVPEGAGFDPERLAGAGSISGNRLGGGGANLKLAGGAAAVVLLLIVVGFFFLGGSDDSAPVQVAQTPAAPAPQPTATPPTAPPETTPQPAQTAPQTPMDVARSAAESSSGSSSSMVTETVTESPSADAGSTVSAAGAAAESMQSEVPSEPSETVIAEVSSPDAMVSESVVEPAASSAAPPVAESALVARAMQPTAPAPEAAETTEAESVSSDPMPQLDANSPARALSPPISIRRAEAEFSGVGNLVTVREVSQSAQDNVTAGYNALVRGDIGFALELYSSAVESEPTSVMAQLGRSAALQKLGRMEEARAGYENVLRLDPNNREALTNLTSIYSARAPNEALSRLITLEREYPDFSPVKAQIGLLYARMGSTDDALSYLRQAASLDPATVMYQYNLAVLLDRMGRAEQAVLSYERVLAGIINGGAAGNLSRAGIERRVRYLKTL